MSVSNISFWNFFWGNVGFLPQLLAYIYIGLNIGMIEQVLRGKLDLGIYGVALLALGLLALLATVLLCTYVAKKELKNILRQEELKKEELLKGQSSSSVGKEVESIDGTSKGADNL